MKKWLISVKVVETSINLPLGMPFIVLCGKKAWLKSAQQKCASSWPFGCLQQNICRLLHTCQTCIQDEARKLWPLLPITIASLPTTQKHFDWAAVKLTTLLTSNLAYMYMWLSKSLVRCNALNNLWESSKRLIHTSCLIKSLAPYLLAIIHLIFLEVYFY